MKNESSNLYKYEKFLEEILKKTHDPIHKRLIQAYKGDDPVNSMESELKGILMEVLRHED